MTPSAVRALPTVPTPHDTPWYRALMSLVVEARVDLHDWIEEEDLLCLHWALTGLSRKSGRRIVWPGAGFVRYRGDEVVERATYLDHFNLLAQLDLVPRVSPERILTGELLLEDVLEAAREADEAGGPGEPGRVPREIARPARRILVRPGPRVQGKASRKVLEALDRLAPMGVLVPVDPPDTAESPLLSLPLPDQGQLEVLFAGRAFGMALVDTEDRLLETNLTFTDFVDQDLDRLAGTRFRDLLHPDDRAEDERRFRDLVAGSISHYRLEARLLRRSAVIHADLSAARVERPGAPDLVLRAIRDESGRRLEEVVRFQETERRLLSYDLHDGLAQDLASLWMFLQTGRALEGSDPGAAGELTRRTLGLVQRMSRELERKMRDLRTPVTQGVDLPRALRQLVADFAEDAIQVRLEMSPALAGLVGVPALFVYRIVQEGLRNAVRHGHARSARVEVRVEGPDVVGEIRDDGRGFDPAKVTPRRGYGMAGMRERCGLLGGGFEVDSEPGRGTTLRFRLATP